MKKRVYLITLLFQSLFLFGCLRIEDVQETEEDIGETPVVSQKEDFNLSYVVSGEVFVFQGQLLNKDSYWAAVKETTLPLNEPQLFKFRQLTFLPKSILYTMGADVKFEVQQVVSSGGKISTFPANMSAVMGASGRSGGFIYFHGAVASGELRFELRGENGGRGLTGRAPDLALKGKDGYRLPGKCYEGGMSALGEAGKPGYTGGQGNAGGDTGNLEIYLKSEKDFRYGVERFPGEGGPGGFGGEGGEGGFTPASCGNTSERIKGPQGPLGKTGEQGKVGKVCLTDKSTTTCF